MRTKPASNSGDYENLVMPHERQVYFLCLNMMGNREDAEDCAQEALLKAYRALGSFRGDAKVSTWLYTLATRVCLDALRRRKDALSLDMLREEGFDVPSQEAGAYLQLETAERKRLLKAAISLLPPDFRAAVVLCDLNSLPYQEAAQVLSIPEGTLKSRLNRARKSLFKTLSKEGELFLETARLNGERRESHEL